MHHCEAVHLVEEALFLQMYGERPPGAPPDPQAETWRNWNRKAEAHLRSLQGDHGDRVTEIPYPGPLPRLEGDDIIKRWDQKGP